MIHPHLSSPTDPAALLLSRRFLLGGGLVAGAALMTGCQSSGRLGALPAPRWPSDTRPMPAPPTPAPGPAHAVAPPGVIPRAQWTRAGVAKSWDINPMNGVSRITIHHDAMPSQRIRAAADAAARLEQVRRAHVEDRGWADIGYHYIIDPAGRVWEGRSTRYQGAHVADTNENNLGIMVMGNFDQQTPTPQALAALERFTGQQMARYRIPLARVHTHQELKPTRCPGNALQAFMVRARVPGGALARASSGASALG
ncbi:MAG TPA: peptidoglycan recognition family protein [Phycisphaerales bacterium]|nr:peptidoglycan recognition family protein [Phycisphaerales bacterium]